MNNSVTCQKRPEIQNDFLIKKKRKSTRNVILNAALV